MEKREALFQILQRFKELGIAEQLNYDKFTRCALITHSSAFEGSTLTEIDNQLLFGERIAPKDKSQGEQWMNLDLKEAYDQAIGWATLHQEFSVEKLCQLSAIVMQHTGRKYDCPKGSFDAGKGELRLVNATAGAGGSSYLSYLLVPSCLQTFCVQMNERRMMLLLNRNVYEAYMLSFDAYYMLVSIHPWGDGNGRMARLIMNALQYEFGLVPSRVMKENKAECIAAWLRARDQDNAEPFRNFLLQEHIDNLSNEIDKYQKDNVFNPLNLINEPQKNHSEPLDFPNEPQEKNHSEPHGLNNEPQRLKYNEPQRTSIESLILEAIRENNKITREELAELTGTSLSTVKRRLKNMGDIVEYIGSGYSGYWRIKGTQSSLE